MEVRLPEEHADTGEGTGITTWSDSIQGTEVLVYTPRTSILKPDGTYFFAEAYLVTSATSGGFVSSPIRLSEASIKGS